MATLYGCCGFLDLCNDVDLMSLSFAGGDKFLDWLGWQKTDVCIIKKTFLTTVRAAEVLGVKSSGVVSNPCAGANGAEWGGCDFTIEDFGRIRRTGPTRDVTKVNLKYCEIQPRYRLDGSIIANDVEYDMRIATEVLLQDLKGLVVSGTIVNAGEFDGLESLVKTGYTGSNGHRCTSMDSVVIDMAANDMNGGAGMTWNGAAIDATFDFIDILLAAFRRILDRIQMAPALASASLVAGDVVFVAPTHLLRCLLNAYTCWSVCPGTQYNEVSIQNYEARTFRNTLNGGMFQAGRIYLDGFEIPLIAYNWGLIKGPTLSDAYLLTGKVGTIRLINGQFNDMSVVPPTYPDGAYSYTDGGRLLTWAEKDSTCLHRTVEMQPRLLMWAPWAQVRFENIRCTPPGGIISPDPWETSFFPETSFDAPACP
jgi:hypothetical protein